MKRTSPFRRTSRPADQHHPWWVSARPSLVAWLALFLACSGTGAAFAQESPETEKTPEAGESSEEIPHRTVVTPSRSTSNDFDTDRSVYVVGDETLHRAQASDAPEAMEDLPGVHVQRTNRGAATPIIRGFTGTQNLLLLDGVRFNTSTLRTGPQQMAALVDPLMLQSIELVSGPGSVLYGSDAIGGTIHYRTLQTPGKPGWFARAEGRFASADLGSDVSTIFGGREGNVAGWAGGAFRRHDALRVGGGLSVPLSDFMQGDWRAKGDVTWGDGWSLTGAWFGTLLQGAGRVDNLGKGDVRIYDNQDDVAYLIVRRQDPEELFGEFKVQLSYHRLAETIHRTTCQVDGDGDISAIGACIAMDDATITRKRRYEDTTHAMALSAGSLLRFLDDRLRLQLGIDGRIELVESRLEDARADEGFVYTDKNRGNFSDGSQFGAMDAYASLDGLPYVEEGRFRLGLTGGLRVAHSRAWAPDVPGLGTVRYDNTGVALNAGARLVFANAVNIFFSYGQGYRSPNLQESTVLGDTGTFFEVPNGDLRPEQSGTAEFGLKVHDRWLRLRGAFFYTQVHDVIVREETTYEGQATIEGKEVVHRVNADVGEFYGLEVSAEVGPFDGVIIYGDASWVEGSTGEKDSTLSPARRIPPAQGSAGVRWKGAPMNLYVDGFVRWSAPQSRLSSGDRKDLRICTDPAHPGTTLGDACEGTPGWATLNLRAGVTPLKGLRVDVGLLNILDTNYRIHGSGYDGPGINGKISVRYDFQ